MYASRIIFMNVCTVISVAIVILLRDLGTYRLIFMNGRVVISVAIVILLGDFEAYGLIFMTVSLLL
jgi:hypothetical protein